MNSELEMLMSMLKDVDDQVKTMEDLTDMNITDTHGMKTAIKNVLEEAQLSTEDIEALDAPAIESLFELNEDKLEAIKVQFGADGWLTEAKRIVIEINASVKDLAVVKEQRDKLVEEKDKVLKEYSAFINSPEYKAQRAEKIADLTKRCEEEKDEIKKKKLQKVLESIKSLDTLAFLFTRFTKDPDAEIESIVEAFFNDTKSKYIMARYTEKMKHLKNVDPRMYRFFFNLEETFLDEKYQVFNNLFLFFVMRFIAYSDVSDRHENMYIRAIISNLYKLQYHEFKSEEDELAFKAIIQKVLDNFTEYGAQFELHNATHPYHPRRIQKDEEKRVEELAMLKGLYEKEEWEFDETLPLNTLKETYRTMYAEKYPKQEEKTAISVDEAIAIAESANQPIQSVEATE